MKTQVISQNRFEVDHIGLKLQMKSVSPFRVVQELIANSFDEDTVKVINVSVKFERPYTVIIVEDDGVGFKDVADVFTMYKYSEKRKNTEKRGRFNLGEKQFFSLAEDGYVETGNHRISFKDSNRISETVETPFKGTKVFARIDWSSNIVRDILVNLHRLIVPEDKELFVNDTEVKHKVPVKKFVTQLWTLIEDHDTKIAKRVKKTTNVELFRVEDGEAWLYEMGIPVVKLIQNIDWHVNIMQKIPLSTSRNSVTESYLKDLYGSILNNAVELINEDDAGARWISTAMASATEQTAKSILVKQYGTDKIMIPSTTDYRANEQAIESGVELVKLNTLDRDTKNHLKEIGVLKYASDEFKTNFAQADNVEPNEKMIKFAEVVKLMAKDVIKKNIGVSFLSLKGSGTLADYGQNHMRFNVGVLGKSFFNQFSPEAIGLIIHELAHDKHSHDDGIAHLSHDYLHEMQRIAGLVGKVGISHWENQI